MVNSASPLLQSSRADSAESDGSSGSNKSNKQRLTKEQKKANHINSGTFPNILPIFLPF